MKLLSITFLAFFGCFQLCGFDLERDVLAVQDALQAGDLENASRLLETALSKHPQNGGLLNLRGVLHAQRNEVAAARQDFSEAVRLDPSLTPAWQNLARACQIQGDHDSRALACAAESWQRVLRGRPEDEEARSSLALAYTQQERYTESLRELDRLSAGEAGKSRNLLLRCADLAALGRVQEALTTASTLRGREDFSDSEFGELEGAFVSPKSAPVVVSLVQALDQKHAVGIASLRRLGIALEQLKRPAEARQILERVALLDPKNVSHLLELARLANQSKDHEGAIGYLAHARDLEPNNAQIHYLFAMVTTEMELPLEARASLEKALAIDPENPAYNYAMGFVILSTRDAATASSYFEKFVRAKPGLAKGHYALGIAYYASGDYAKSKEEMQRIKANAETTGGAEYFLGRIARQEDDMDGATKHLRRSIAIMPQFAEPHTELARVELSAGNLKAAEAELHEAVRLDPKSFQANSQLLAVYRRTRDARSAEQEKRVKALDEERSKRTELMLRTIEVRP